MATQEEVKDLMREAIRYGVMALFEGEPGLGKSQMLAQVADEFYGPPTVKTVTLNQLGMQKQIIERPYYLPVHLSTADPTDLPGVLYVSPKDGEPHRTKPEWYPPADVHEGVIGLEELGQCPMIVQNPTMQLILERRIGTWVLEPGWSLVALTNSSKHRAGAIEINRALLDRFPIRATVTVDAKQFRQYALKSDFNPKITSFLSLRPELTQAYNPEQKSSPTCRGWEQVSDVIDIIPPHLLAEVITGIQGEGCATEFMAHMRLSDKVNPEEIIADPVNAKIHKQNPDIMWATIGAITSHIGKTADLDTLERVVTYARRMPAEFGLVFVRDLMLNYQDVMLTMKSVDEWINSNENLLAI